MARRSGSFSLRAEEKQSLISGHSVCERIGAVICLMPFFVPLSFDYFELVPFFHEMCAAARYVISFFAVLLFLESRIPSLQLGLAAGVEIFCVITSLVLGDFYLTYGLSCFSFIGFAALNILIYKADRRFLFSFYRVVLGLYLVVDFATRVLFPEGLICGMTGDGRVWFLGGKNKLPLYLICFAFFCFEKMRRSDALTRKRLLGILVLICFMSLYLPSSTSVVAVAFILAFACVSRRRVGQVIALWVLLLSTAGFFFLVVLGWGVGFDLSALTSLLGKNATFSGRRAIWDMAIQMIGQAPLGTGVYVEFNPWPNPDNIVYSAHNTFLDIAVRLGILPVFLLVATILSILKAYKRSFPEERIFPFFFALSILASMMEANQGYYIFWVLISMGACMTCGQRKKAHSSVVCLDERIKE
ncbi:hypothetical protein D1643_04975 [Enterorhabdus sp. P55]|nr:hypothetical protein [Enterorhabdus sp. P55]